LVLKGLDPLLGPHLLSVLRAMGHGDEIAIVDANYPAVAHAKRLVRMDGVAAVDLVGAIVSVLPLDHAEGDCAFRPGFVDRPHHREPIMTEFERLVQRHDPQARVIPLFGQAFYDRVRSAYAIVASGERRLYGNLILKKGVIGPPFA
jgi:L-fucose mutarotase